MHPKQSKILLSQPPDPALEDSFLLRTISRSRSHWQAQGNRLLGFALLVLLLAQPACVTTSNTRTTAVPYDPAGTSPAAGANPASPESPVIPPVALPAQGPRPDETPPTGSIWTPASFSMYQDLKAKRVGDTLTITVVENSDASKQAGTTTGRSRDNSADFNFAGLTYGASTLVQPVKTGYTGKFDNNFKGSGVTTKTDKMSAYMSATVVDVLPNGNLLIRGARWTKVNDELQQMILEGIVRPVDIDNKNQILSQKIADAKIFFIGKGPVSTQQRPGWLGQLFDLINPF